MPRSNINPKRGVHCHRIGGCLKRLIGPDAECLCDHPINCECNVPECRYYRHHGDPREGTEPAARTEGAEREGSEFRLCRDCPTPLACAKWPEPKCLRPFDDERQMRESVVEYLGILREGRITATQAVRNRIVTLACILFGEPRAEPPSASGSEGAEREITGSGK